jgi:NTE family protein
MPTGPRVGLVLGAGGVVGHAFHAGVLAALTEETGWDPRDADVVVGTSAGSVVGALLRAGASAPDLLARATGRPLSSEGRHLVERSERVPAPLGPIPSRPERRFPSFSSSPRALSRAALRPWTTRPGAFAAALLPAGRIPTELVAAGFRPLFDAWPHDALWVNAVELDSGRRVVFGRDTGVETTVADAVAASCAIPSFFAPVVIDGARYVDGGVHSPTNAELVAGLELDLVIVSSPMSIASAAPRLAPDQLARRWARVLLAREVARVRRAGTPVLTFQPTATDLAVMGLNAMAEDRRAPVATTAFDTARRRIASSRSTDRVATLRRSASSRPA